MAGICWSGISVFLYRPQDCTGEHISDNEENHACCNQAADCMSCALRKPCHHLCDQPENHGGCSQCTPADQGNSIAGHIAQAEFTLPVRLVSGAAVFHPVGQPGDRPRCRISEKPQCSGENDGTEKGGALVGQVVAMIKCQDQQHHGCRGNEDAQPNADPVGKLIKRCPCLLYTSDAADD